MTTDRLPRETRLLVAANTVSSLGTGLVLPLTLIYLHQVRGIPLPIVGALLTMGAVVSLIAVPATGVLLDRVGARPVLMVVLLGQALAQAGLAWAHSVPTAIPALLVLGASQGPSFPAYQTMMAGTNPDPQQQQRAFAVSFTGINAGVGLGSAIGAAVADVHHPGTFQVLFLANALSCVLCAAVIAWLPNVRAPHGPDMQRAGYREVLANRGLRTVMIATLVIAFTGYAALDSGLPAYATVEAHVSVHVVALSLAVNTAVIVASQLVVLRLVRTLRRSRALAAIGLTWALSYLVFGLSGLPVSSAARITCVFLFTAMFGIGETIMAPTIPPLVNRLADDHIRGRANALASLTYSVAFVISPAVCTTMIATGFAGVWVGLLCAGCLGTALLGIRLGRRLTPAQDQVSAPAPAPAEPAPVPTQ
ncbi:MAG TPA: MFS transporter [Streptosporangiaceae bacterium]|nr:MFS transporter [Streptosporangiaceae bacterium]